MKQLIFKALLALSVSTAWSQINLIDTYTAGVSPQGGLDKVIVLANEDMYAQPALQSRIDRYAQDINNFYGPEVLLYTSPINTPQELKSFIMSHRTDLNGVVFVGNLAKAGMESFIEGHTPRDIYHSDFYYMNFDATWFDRGISRNLLFSDTPTEINEDWGAGSPDPSVPVDYFSGQWRGQLTPSQTGEYTLRVTSDNGVRVYINNNRVINEWNGSWGNTYTHDIEFTSGVSVDLQVDYYENWGGASITLEWERPDGVIEVIPASAYADLTVDYYDNKWLEGGGLQFDNNGLFDFVGNSEGTIDASIMKPNIFVGRIETHTSTKYGEEYALMEQYLDKNHRYYSGQMQLGTRGVVHLGSGSTVADANAVSNVGYMTAVYGDPALFDLKVDDATAAPGMAATDVNWLADLAHSDVLTAIYNGHGNENGIGIRGNINGDDLIDQTVNPLFIQLQSCSPTRSFEAVNGIGGDRDSYIGGAHLYADNGRGNSLALIGATKTSGGDQREVFLYDAFAENKVVGLAFLDWANQRIDTDPDFQEKDMTYFYPEVIVGDPLVRLFDTPQPVTVSAGKYEIKNSESGKCIEAGAASKSAGANIEQYHCNKTKTQRWDIEPIADDPGYFSIVNANSNFHMNVQNSGSSDNIEQWGSVIGDPQRRWKIEEVELGKFIIKSKLDESECLTSDNSFSGANIETALCSQTIEQVWELNDALSTVALDGNFEIRNKNSYKCLDVNGASLFDGANVQQYECNNTGAQKWSVRNVSGSVYEIINQNSGKHLDVAWGGHSSNVQQWGVSTPGISQKWELTELNAGVYSLQSLSNRKCLDVAGASVQSHANIQVYNCNRTGAQKFIFNQIN
ncbi:MAG: RICIN domain-containing protein [Fibrobacterales bacterium]